MSMPRLSGFWQALVGDDGLGSSKGPEVPLAGSGPQAIGVESSARSHVVTAALPELSHRAIP